MNFFNRRRITYYIPFVLCILTTSTFAMDDVKEDRAVESFDESNLNDEAITDENFRNIGFYEHLIPPAYADADFFDQKKRPVIKNSRRQATRIRFQGRQPMPPLMNPIGSDSRSPSPLSPSPRSQPLADNSPAAAAATDLAQQLDNLSAATRPEFQANQAQLDRQIAVIEDVEVGDARGPLSPTLQRDDLTLESALPRMIPTRFIQYWKSIKSTFRKHKGKIAIGTVVAAAVVVALYYTKKYYDKKNTLTDDKNLDDPIVETPAEIQEGIIEVLADQFE